MLCATVVYSPFYVTVCDFCMVVFYEYKNKYWSVSTVDHCLSCFQVWAIMQKTCRKKISHSFTRILVHICVGLFRNEWRVELVGWRADIDSAARSDAKTLSRMSVAVFIAPAAMGMSASLHLVLSVRCEEVFIVLIFLFLKRYFYSYFVYVFLKWHWIIFFRHIAISDFSLMQETVKNPEVRHNLDLLPGPVDLQQVIKVFFAFPCPVSSKT